MSKTDDRLLTGYSRAVRDVIFKHVYVGKGSGGSQLRELDGLRLLCSVSRVGKVERFRRSRANFRELVKGKMVEVIEVDEDLNRWVIGQTIVGKHLLEIEFEVYATMPVVVCKVQDSPLNQVCAKLGVKVWSPQHCIPALMASFPKGPRLTATGGAIGERGSQTSDLCKKVPHWGPQDLEKSAQGFESTEQFVRL